MDYIEYPEDCKRIQKVILNLCNYDCTLAECDEIWRKRSGTWDASWLYLPQSDIDIIKDINEYTNTTFIIK